MVCGQTLKYNCTSYPGHCDLDNFSVYYPIFMTWTICLLISQSDLSRS